MKDAYGVKRKYLLISTFQEDEHIIKDVYDELRQHIGELEIISTYGKRISHCIGCNDCWIKTPGICCIKDDYEEILIKMLQADCVIFLTETKLGFVCSQMKNLFDRILPLATMHLKFKNGQMRHYSRYKKVPDMTLIYKGFADNNYLNLWLNRVQINLHGKSLGTYELDNRKELYNALSYH